MFTKADLWRPGTAALALAALSFVGFGLLFQRFPVLYDTDSYYHLAIGRAYVHLGFIDVLPWARLSLLNQGFGDKEFLFHVLLMPFSSGDPAATANAGRWALALLNAGVVGALAGLGTRAVGWWGLLLPGLVYGGSLDFLGRAIRLRPELLSLLLILAATVCVGLGRDRLLGVVAALYALSYTAFHAFLGLALGWFFVRGWVLRRWDARPLAYCVAGLGLGLVVHPHFPYNLVVWKVQSVDFFLLRDVLDVGAEIQSRTTETLLKENLPWALGLLALWRAGRRREEPRDGAAELALALHVVTAAFGLLYLLMGRFSIYFVPFATLSVVFELRRRGRTLGGAVALPRRGSAKEPPTLPLAAVLAVVMLIAGWRSGERLVGLSGATGPISREAEWAAFGSAVPPGARVAAPWGQTHLYMFWGPQATYLNVLDPVFMAVPFPRAYQAQRTLFDGEEPDVPLALERELDSNFLAVSRFHPRPELLTRLVADPRLVARYEGYNLLYEAVPGRNDDFLLDWRRVPQGRRLPVPRGEDVGTWPSYPRAERDVERALEGYVDVTRWTSEAPAPGCVALVRPLASEEGPRAFELAASGPTTLWLDEAPTVTDSGAERATLGRGALFYVDGADLAGQGGHRLTALTCPDPGGKHLGFYLRRLPAGTGL